MSTLDPSQCLSVPGRLYLGVTNAGMLAGVPPYGGTELGIKLKHKVIREQAFGYTDSEAYGRDAVAAYGGAFKVSVVFVLIQFDPNIYKKVWSYSTTSPNSFANAIIYTVPKVGSITVPPGVIVPTAPLLHAADDPAHPSVLTLVPIWMLERKSELDTVLNKGLQTSIVVLAGLNGSGDDFRIAKVQNLSIT